MKKTLKHLYQTATIIKDDSLADKVKLVERSPELLEMHNKLEEAYRYIKPNASTKVAP